MMNALIKSLSAAIQQKNKYIIYEGIFIIEYFL
jgi:hypothetical protein